MKDNIFVFFGIFLFCISIFILGMVMIPEKIFENDYFNNRSSLFSSTPTCSEDIVKSTVKDIIIDDSKGLAGLFYSFVKKTLYKSSFTMTNIRPNNVKKSIKKVDCSADIEIGKENYPINYSVQLTEDENYYVELDIVSFRQSILWCNMSYW